MITVIELVTKIGQSVDSINIGGCCNSEESDEEQCSVCKHNLEKIEEFSKAYNDLILLLFGNPSDRRPEPLR